MNPFGPYTITILSSELIDTAGIFELFIRHTTTGYMPSVVSGGSMRNGGVYRDRDIAIEKGYTILTTAKAELDAMMELNRTNGD